MTGELRRRLVGLAIAISQYRECLRKVRQQANRQLNACDLSLIRSRGDGEAQAKGMEKGTEENLVSYLGGNSYLYRSLRSPSVLLCYYIIVLLPYCLIVLLFDCPIVPLSYYIAQYCIFSYLVKDNSNTPIV